jgi:hypothetical protein
VAGLGVLAAGGGAGGGSDQGLPGRVVNGLQGLDGCGIIESGLDNLTETKR